LTEDPLDWLLSLEHLGMKFGLENMSRLVEALDHPERAFRSIHIAGTNGKGSVTAMVDTALRADGVRSARYTSPHLERLNERFVTNGVEVSSDALRDALSAVRSAVERVQAASGPFTPTFFECTTAAAFELFRRDRVEMAVLEVGLGGRLDATNVITPVITAITSIDFDHTGLLGNTLASIAAEKAGIVKPGVAVVIGDMPLDAEQVISATARRLGSPSVRAHGASARFPNLRLALPGKHQQHNADVAVAVLDGLSAAGIGLSEEAIRTGLERVRWPGRLEHRLSGNTEFLIDAAHNRAGAHALAAYMRDIGWTDAALVFGVMADKDISGMLQELAGATGALVCTTAPSPRAASAETLGAIAARIPGHPPTHVVADPAAALDTARRLSGRVVIAGSIFLMGPLRGILR
jgi:dihydrofolate synthase / folylpolyglutamate synthase